jgi:hypothetical protein
LLFTVKILKLLSTLIRYSWTSMPTFFQTVVWESLLFSSSSAFQQHWYSWIFSCFVFRPHCSVLFPENQFPVTSLHVERKKLIVFTFLSLELHSSISCTWPPVTEVDFMDTGLLSDAMEVHFSSLFSLFSSYARIDWSF